MPCKFGPKNANSAAELDVTGNRDQSLAPGYFTNDSACGAGDGTGIDAADLNQIIAALEGVITASGVDCNALAADFSDALTTPLNTLIATAIATERASISAEIDADIAAARALISAEIDADIAAAIAALVIPTLVIGPTTADIAQWTFASTNGSVTLPAGPTTLGYWQVEIAVTGGGSGTIATNGLAHISSPQGGPGTAFSSGEFNYTASGPGEQMITTAHWVSTTLGV